MSHVVRIRRRSTSSRLVRLWSLIALLGIVLFPARVVAQDAAEARGLYHYQDFRLWQYAYTSAMLATAVYLELGPVHQPREPDFRGPILFDAAARDFLSHGSLSTKRQMSDASEWAWHLTELFPFYGSILVGGVIVQGDSRLSAQLALIGAQVMLTVAVLTRLSHLVVVRERPLYHYHDGLTPNQQGSSPTLSFFSGHTALASAGAGLACGFHEHIPLFGGGAADRAVCPAVITGAVVVGWLRIASDRHYLSDVLVGGGLGFTLGYLVPYWLHFRDGDARSRAGWVLPLADRDSIGLQVLGRFH